MHIVLITSMLRPINDHTVFSTNDRKDQTINTIKTVREKIPEAYIVMLEGGETEPSEGILFSNLVDHLYCTDIREYKKSPGEGTLLLRYLTSDHFKSLDNVQTVSKLSGRYYLNEHFNWNLLPLNKFIISLVPIAWMGRPLYKTRYYRIPKIYIQHFIDGLQRYLNSKEAANASPDIEHCFHYHNIIIHDEVYCPEPLGVCGLMTGNNEFVSD